MNESLFIISAYSISGLLLAALVIASWLRMRRARHLLREHDAA